MGARSSSSRTRFGGGKDGGVGGGGEDVFAGVDEDVFAGVDAGVGEVIAFWQLAPFIPGVASPRTCTLQRFHRQYLRVCSKREPSVPFLAESEEAEQFIAEHSEEPASDVAPGRAPASTAQTWRVRNIPPDTAPATPSPPWDTRDPAQHSSHCVAPVPE